jgi:CHASE2 domain-containing sensor protein
MDVISGRQKAGLVMILGVVGLIGVVIAWRTGNQAAFRVTAGALVISVISSLPAFFVDVPAGVKLAVAIFVVFTVLGIVLMFSSDRRPAAVLD